MRVNECVAKTWRYLVSRASFVEFVVVEPLVVGAVASFARWTGVEWESGERSMAEEEAISVIVAMVCGNARRARDI